MVGFGPGLEQEWQGWILLCSPVLSYFPCMCPQVHVARASLDRCKLRFVFAPKWTKRQAPVKHFRVLLALQPWDTASRTAS